MRSAVKTVIHKLPKERQKKILREAQKQIAEFQSLQELRLALGLTQNDIAEILGVHQVNISNLEKRKDMHISTLRKYVEALGCKLEITIRIDDANTVRVKKFARSPGK